MWAKGDKGKDKTNGDDDKQRKGTPGNNQAQNKQTNDAAKQVGLNKDQERKLHDEVTGQNYTYREIFDIARRIKEGSL